MRFHRFTALAFGYALAFLLSGAAFVSAAPKDTLVVANMYDAKSLDPHVTPDLASAHIMVQIYDTLVKVNDKGEVVPNLAEKFERVDDTT